MENTALVFQNSKGQLVTTSLLIAERFKRRHADVLRDIENLSCSQEFRERNFALSSYTTNQNKQMPMYEMVKDGFSFLVMGYTGAEAGKFKEDFIKEFNRREALMNDPDWIMARAFQIMDQRLKALENKVEEDRPKITYHDTVLQSESLISTTDIAKQLGMSAVTLNKELNKRGVQYFASGRWLLYAKYQSRGFTGTKTETFRDGSGRVNTKTHTYWSEKGREFIINLMRQPVMADGSLFTNNETNKS